MDMKIRNISIADVTMDTTEPDTPVSTTDPNEYAFSSTKSRVPSSDNADGKSSREDLVNPETKSNVVAVTDATVGKADPSAPNSNPPDEEAATLSSPKTLASSSSNDDDDDDDDEAVGVANPSAPYSAPAGGEAPSSPKTHGASSSPNDVGKSSSGDQVLSGKAPNAIKETQIEGLLEQGYTRGLAEAMMRNNEVFPLRFWVVDNSGSMACTDGTVLVPEPNGSGLRVEACSRWDELQQTVRYHAKLAGLMRAPTMFRLLNDPNKTNCQQYFSIAKRGEEFIPQDVDIAMQSMDSSPTLGTPLTAHVREIREIILEHEPDLRAAGTKVAIVLATDGLPTDGGIENQDFTKALRSLEGLPVWVVIRLCTDETAVLDFYNKLDAQLELSLEVLDDFEMEAKEVYKHNQFFNYTLPLHRCREMGYFNRLFDLLDERKLTIGELRELLVLIFGEDAFDGVPDPNVDWNSFASAVSEMNEDERHQWNPITKKVGPWLDIKKLNRAYGGRRRRWRPKWL